MLFFLVLPRFFFQLFDVGQKFRIIYTHSSSSILTPEEDLELFFFLRGGGGEQICYE